MQDGVMGSLVSSRARRSRNVVRVALVAALLWAVVYQGFGLLVLTGHAAQTPGWFRDEPPVGWSDWLAQLLSSLSILMALRWASRLLGRLVQGEGFSNGVGAELRGFACWLFAAIASRICVPPLVAAIGLLVGSHVPGSIEITAGDFLILVASAVLYEISRLLDDAHRLAADYQQII